MAEFVPSLWSEEKVPAAALNCQRCELHKQRSRVIWGEGNPRAPILIVLDNPGAREDKEGRDSSAASAKPCRQRPIMPVFPLRICVSHTSSSAGPPPL